MREARYEEGREECRRGGPPDAEDGLRRAPEGLVHSLAQGAGDDEIPPPPPEVLQGRGQVGLIGGRLEVDPDEKSDPNDEEPEDDVDEEVEHAGVERHEQLRAHGVMVTVGSHHGREQEDLGSPV